MKISQQESINSFQEFQENIKLFIQTYLDRYEKEKFFKVNVLTYFNSRICSIIKC